MSAASPSAAELREIAGHLEVLSMQVHAMLLKLHADDRAESMSLLQILMEHGPDPDIPRRVVELLVRVLLRRSEKRGRPTISNGVVLRMVSTRPSAQVKV